MIENRTEDVRENEVGGVRSWKERREQRGERGGELCFRNQNEGIIGISKNGSYCILQNEQKITSDFVHI